MCTGIPCCVTHAICSSDSRRSSESLRTTWTPGMTSVPRPVTILKPSDSPVSSFDRWWSPEMTSASFGSATRHIARNSMMKMANATTMTPMMRTADPSSVVTFFLPAPAWSRLGDDYRPWRIVLDDHHSGSDRDALRIARVRVEVFCTSTHGEHALPDPTGTDRPRHAPDFPHDLVRDGPPPLRSKTPVRTGRDTGCYAALRPNPARIIR